MRRVWPASLLVLLLAGSAEAAQSCTFTSAGSTWTLDADCTTDSSIVIPDGITLDGAHHTILAIDPVDGYFHGAIIVNGGALAGVTNTIVGALLLADVCQPGADRLRGIYFDGASGVIRGNTLININKGASACQEGNAIEVRNPVLSGAPLAVEILGNTVDAFQKSGIVASGNVDVLIRGNSVGPSATQSLMAANGIQVGAGARADVEANTVAGNSWDGSDAAATGILLVATARGTTVRGNVIAGNADVGIYVMTDGARVERNRLIDSGTDGAYDVGIGNYGEDNVFDGNSITGYGRRYQGVSEPGAGAHTVAAR